MITKKSFTADLENKRSIFLETGLIISLSVAILTINWKTFDPLSVTSLKRDFEDIPEEMVPVTQQKPPEPPKVIIMPPVVTNIEIVEDSDPVDNDYFIDAEAGPSDTIARYIPQVKGFKDEEVTDEAEIFEVVESWPEFPGGNSALYAFLGNNLVYPELAKEIGISGKVYLNFVVEKDGSITDVKVIRGIGGGCDEEALRVVNKMPKWTPGKQRGIPVRVRYIFSVRFILER